MPLTEDEERAEHQLRMEQMAVNIEKMRLDIRQESRRIMLQTAAAAGALFGGGAAALALVLHWMGRL